MRLALLWLVIGCQTLWAWQVQSSVDSLEKQTHSALSHWQVTDNGGLLLARGHEQIWVQGPASFRIEGRQLRLLSGQYQWHSQADSQLLLVHARLQSLQPGLLRLKIDPEGTSQIWLLEGSGELIYGPRNSLHYLHAFQGLTFSLSVPPHGNVEPLAPLTQPSQPLAARALTPVEQSDPVTVIDQQPLLGPDRPSLTLATRAWSQYSGHQQQHRYRHPLVDTKGDPGILHHFDLSLHSWHWLDNQLAWQWRFTQDWQYDQDWRGQGVGLGVGWHYLDQHQHQWWLQWRTLGQDEFAQGLDIHYQWQGDAWGGQHDVAAGLSLNTNWQRDLGISDHWHWQLTQPDQGWLHQNKVAWHRQQSPNVDPYSQQSWQLASRQRLNPGPVRLELPISLNWLKTPTTDYQMQLGLGAEVIQEWQQGYQLSYFFHWQQGLQDLDSPAYHWRGGIEIQLLAQLVRPIRYRP